MIALTPTPVSGWQAFWQRFHLPLLQPLRVFPTLLIVHLLVSIPDTEILRVPLTLLAAAGLLFRSWLRTTAYWYVMATCLGTAIYFHWESADNHRYLFAYAALALCAACSLPRGEQAEGLALSCRWLLGLAMALATTWKLCSPDYLDGTLFTSELLLDERFAPLTTWLTELTPQALLQNREAARLLMTGHELGLQLTSVHLTQSPGVTTLAHLLTWWTVGIEAALALLFLLPTPLLERCRLGGMKNGLLVLFGVTTYLVAPIRGFGGILMLLGLAQCRPQQQQAQYAYLLAFLAIQLFTLPLSAMLNWLLAIY